MRRAPLRVRPALAVLVAGLGVGLGAALGSARGLAATPSSRGVPGGAASEGAGARVPAPLAPLLSRKRPATKVHRRKVLVAPARGGSRLTLAASAPRGAEPLVDLSSLPAPVAGGTCPPEMANVEERYCVDRYEASLVEMGLGEGERPFSPYVPVNGHDVRAVSVAGVFPQGYVSAVDAAAACARSGKRLCRAAEWRKACAGPRGLQYGYADRRERGRCNDAGRSPMIALFHIAVDASPKEWDPVRMNDARLNQVEGGLALTGAHPACTNAYGVLDMVGNLHEWVDDREGTFQGGYYLDTTLNGEGCGYVTRAHEALYHDYSTGFRCCADVAEGASLPPDRIGE